MTADGSDVLNDMIESCLPSSADSASVRNEIRFTDCDIESSEVLVVALEIIMRFGTSLRLGDLNDYRGCQCICRAVAFLQKYKCEASLSFFGIYALNQYLSVPSRPFYFFMIAAALDDVEFSVLCFKKRWSVSFRYATPDVVSQHGVPGVNDIEGLEGLLELEPTETGFESGFLPHELWTSLPLDYIWALGRLWWKVYEDKRRYGLLKRYRFFSFDGNPPAYISFIRPSFYRAAIKTIKEMD